MKATEDLKVSKYFYLPELIPPDLFSSQGINAKEKLSPILLKLIDKIREAWGKPLFINNWLQSYTGTKESAEKCLINPSLFKYCGYRPPNCTEGAKLSDHRGAKNLQGQCEAVDLHAFEPEIKLWEMIYKNYNNFPELTKLEDKLLTIKNNRGWVHVSVAHTGYNGVYVIDNVKVTEKLNRK